MYAEAGAEGLASGWEIKGTNNASEGMSASRAQHAARKNCSDRSLIQCMNRIFPDHDVPDQDRGLFSALPISLCLGRTVCSC
jgi:hypothetical protein